MGELVILSGMVLGGHFVIFVLACLVLTVVFVATGRSLFPMIWGEPTKVFAEERETFVGFGPHLFFVAFVLLIGVYVPAPINNLFLQVANTLGGH
jgi:hydrogenase-4 component F